MNKKTAFYAVWFAVSIPIGIFRAWVMMTIYNAFMPQLFGLPEIPSVWYAALIGLLIGLFTPLPEASTEKDSETRMVEGCGRTAALFLQALFALAFAWLYMQLGGVQ